MNIFSPAYDGHEEIKDIYFWFGLQTDEISLL